jgi:CRP/FNR family transcriptional regulator, anaerobic regulatory protein
MYSKVIKYIQDRIMISEAELQKSFNYSEPKTYAKGENILQIGQYCNFIGFLNKGLIITTILDNEGNEKASSFIPEGCFFTYTEGLTTNTASHKNFIAFEECETIIMAKENLAIIFKENRKFETLLTQILAEEVKYLLLNEQASKTMSLEERYLNIENQFPNAFQRIPMKYLADYLGIEPQSLSRLRKRLSLK